MTIQEFIQSQENELRKPISKVNWEGIYKDALRIRYDLVGEFTEFLIKLNIHPEDYLKELPSYFLYQSAIKEFTISDNVIKIGQSAFDDCRSLTNITIGNSVASIGSYAFWRCLRLKNVVIPNSVIDIGERAFWGLYES